MPGTMVWIWLGVLAAAAVLESLTLALVSIWFAAGAFVAALIAYAGGALAAQGLAFVAVSIVALVIARPLARKFIDPHIVPTNADRLLGGAATVTEDISNTSGAAYADGKTWTARSLDDQPIPAGQTVEIVRLEGVKLIVRPKAPVA